VSSKTNVWPLLLEAVPTITPLSLIAFADASPPEVPVPGALRSVTVRSGTLDGYGMRIFRRRKAA
jgi:hypothetical protein